MICTKIPAKSTWNLFQTKLFSDWCGHQRHYNFLKNLIKEEREKKAFRRLFKLRFGSWKNVYKNEV